MRFLLRILVALGLAAFVAAIGVATVGLNAKPRPADVAIVFGNKVEASGKPSARLRARLEAARALFRARHVKAIIVSGGTGKEGFDEAAVMKQYLVARSVPADAIYTDADGTNTERTCANARMLMTAHRWKRADVVTQYFHIARASLACRRAGIDVAGAVAPRYYEPRDAYSLAREVVALPVYVLTRRR